MSTAFFRRKDDCPEFDYYATPRAVDELLKLERFSPNIWEPCCGGVHISETLLAYGYKVRSTDIADHGYGQPGVDFLKQLAPIEEDIITNPAYVQAQGFVEHALSRLTEGHKVAMFLRLSFLEGQARRRLFDRYPPIRVHLSSQRFGCAPNGEFKVRPSGELYWPSAVAYAWFIWEAGYRGPVTIDWF